MKKGFILAILVLVALGLSLGLSAHDGEAKNAYLNDVNGTCGSSYGCGLCHIDPKGGGPLTADGEAYVASGYDNCSFCPTVCGTPVDSDGDGYDSTADCNDNDASINPGATEICDDATDNDCNGLIDLEDPACGVPPTCTDSDGDGYSAEGGDCGAADCNDADAAINPGACDIKADGIDQDCSGKDRLKGKACPGGASPEGKGKTCKDGIDNDLDGATDCADTDCASAKVCI